MGKFKITVVGNLGGNAAPAAGEVDDGYDGIRIRMGDRDRDAIKALMDVTFLPGSNPKRFVRQMAALSADTAAMWTSRQHEFLWDLVYHYRRQITDEKLIAEGQAVHNSPGHRGLEV